MSLHAIHTTGIRTLKSFNNTKREGETIVVM